MDAWNKATVISNRHWTDNLFSLRLDAEVHAFEAGQYTELALDVDGKRVADPYSILSAPDERPLEFFFYTRTEGDLSTELSRLQSGDTLWIKPRPTGDFTLRHVADGEVLWLLATGTGVAPFLSLLRTDEPWQRFHHVVLVYAVRYPDDLCYTDIVDALQLKYPGRLTFVPFVSRVKTEDTVHGHIPDCISRGVLEKVSAQTLSPEHSRVMLCGNPGMVRDAVSELYVRGFTDRKAGADQGQLTYESYW